MNRGAAKIENLFSRDGCVLLSPCQGMFILFNIIKFLSAVLTFCCLLYTINTPCFLFDSLRPSQQFFQLIRDGSSWVEPVLSKDKSVLLKDTT